MKTREVYKFRCKNCGSRKTKRHGTTTQREKKSRYFCYNCLNLSKKKNDKRHVFFILSNQEMKEQIIKDINLSVEEIELFLNKYLIKE